MRQRKYSGIGDVAENIERRKAGIKLSGITVPVGEVTDDLTENRPMVSGQVWCQ